MTDPAPADPQPAQAQAPTTEPAAISPESLLSFYTEVIKLNREEVRDLGIVWVYILIGAGAGFLTKVDINPDRAQSIGLAACFGIFACFYMARIHACYSAIIDACRGLRDHHLLPRDELRRLELLPRQAYFNGVLLAVVPVLAMVMVIWLVAQ